MSMPDEELGIEPLGDLSFRYPLDVDSSRKIRIKNTSETNPVLFKVKATRKIFKARKGGAWGLLGPLDELTIKIYFRPPNVDPDSLRRCFSQKLEIDFWTMYPPKDFVVDKSSITKLFSNYGLKRFDPEKWQSPTIVLPCETKIPVEVTETSDWIGPSKDAVGTEVAGDQTAVEKTDGKIMLSELVD